MSYLRKLAARAVDQAQSIRPRLTSLFEPIGPTSRPVETSSRRVRTPRRENQRSRNDPPRGVTTNQTFSIAGQEPDVRRVTTNVRDEQRDPPRSSSVEDRHLIEKPSPLIAESLVAPRSVDHQIVVDHQIAVDQPGEHTSGLMPSAPELEAPLQIRPSAPEPTQPEILIAEKTILERTVLAETAAVALSQSDSSSIERPQPVESVRTPSVIVKPEVTPTAIVSAAIEAAAPLGERSPPSIRITIGRVDVRAIMPATQSPPVVSRPAASRALSLDEYLKQRNGAAK